MAAFDHNGVPGSALDRELRGLNCVRCDRLSSDLAARDAELAALTLQFSEMRRRWQLRDLYATQQEERAEAAERERDAAFAMSKCECGPEECCANLVKLQADRDEWKRKAEEAARDAAMGQILMRYIDRLSDPVDDDTLGVIVAQLIRAFHDAAIEAKGEA